MHHRIRPLIYALPACLVGLAATSWAIIAIACIEYIRPRGSVSDFAHFYAAAKALRMGVGPGIYSPTLLLQIDRLPGGCAGAISKTPYNNPPLLAMLFQPLTALSCVAAFRLWRIMSLAIWTCVIVLLAWQVWHRCARRGMSRPRSALAAAFITALSTFSFPVLDGLELGQVHLLILGGIVLAWWLREHDRPVAAGVILSVITLIKLLPAVLIVYFLLRRDWRVLAGVAIGTVLLFGVMLVDAGGLPTLLAMIPALTATPAILPQYNTAVVRVQPLLGRAVVAGVLFTFVFAVLFMQRRGRMKEADPALGYAWAICTMLVVSPIVWLHYLTWLLPVIAACLPHVRGWRRTVALGVASVALLISMPALLGAATVAVLLCWALTGWFYVQSSRLQSAGLTPHRQPALVGGGLSPYGLVAGHASGAGDHAATAAP